MSRSGGGGSSSSFKISRGDIKIVLDGATAERQLGKAKGTSGKTLSIANTFTARFSNVTYE